MVWRVKIFIEIFSWMASNSRKSRENLDPRNISAIWHYIRYTPHSIIHNIVPLELPVSCRWLWMWPHSWFSWVWTDSGGTRQNRDPAIQYIIHCMCPQLKSILSCMYRWFATTSTLNCNQFSSFTPPQSYGSELVLCLFTLPVLGCVIHIQHSKGILLL